MSAFVAAKPYDLEVPRERAALLVVDMQHEFLSVGGYASALGRDLEQVRDAVPAVQRAIAAARSAGMAVIFTRESHRPDLSDCPPPKLERSRVAGAEIGGQGALGRRLVRGEKGNELVPEMDVHPEDVIIDKPGKGAFFATDLDLVLRAQSLSHLFVCGISTNVCVNTTVREANDRGYWTLVLEDGCAGYTPALHEAALEMVCTGGGILGWVTRVSELEQLAKNNEV
jgi:biuret amidohydrolase